MLLDSDAPAAQAEVADRTAAPMRIARLEAWWVRIPIEARSVVCVCRSCADGTTDENQRRHLALRWTRR